MDMSDSVYWERAMERVTEREADKRAYKLGRPLTDAEYEALYENIESTHADVIEEEAFEMAIGAAESRFEGDR
jgi:hypothetical protein